MRVRRGSRSTGALQWTGVLAAPLAWVGQLVVGYGVEEADCNEAGIRWDVGTTGWNLALLIATVAVGAAGLLAALALWRSARAQGADDPRGRVAFLAWWGVFSSAIFVTLILLGGIGSLFLEPCFQG